MKVTAESLACRTSWDDIDLQAVDQLIQWAKQEDLEGYGLIAQPKHAFDLTSSLVQTKSMSDNPSLSARQDMVVCGLPLVPRILKQYGDNANFEAKVSDGTYVQKGETVGSFSGAPNEILQAERIILNFLQHLSGISTITQHYVSRIEHSSTKLLDTRKTTPGYRVLQKLAVAMGGGYNHRMGLFDRIMLKDNHLAASMSQSGSSLANLIDSARTKFPTVPLEVEVDTLDQLETVISSGADIVLLDNFSLEELKTACSMTKGKIITEASGGITESTISVIAAIGLDFISTGATIHQAQWVDIGLDW